MSSRKLNVGACLVLSTMLCAVPGRSFAQVPTSSWSQEDTVKIVNEVQKKLGNLTDYDVFDWITFGIQGRTVILRGYASRSILKSDAQSAVKSIPGIERVDNEIQVLPNSPNDDRIRAQVYNRIYTAPTLSRYNADAGPIFRGLSIARMAGGITVDPPLGYHAIHIIVNNGHVTLYGVVDSSSDAAIANMQANSAPGAFSVDNDLVVQGQGKKEK